METNEVMEVEAIEVETDLVPCDEDMQVVAESSGLNTLGGVALLLGAVVGGAAVIMKGSQKVYVKACNKKDVPINTREKAWQFWRPKAKKVMDAREVSETCGSRGVEIYKTVFERGEAKKEETEWEKEDEA